MEYNLQKFYKKFLKIFGHPQIRIITNTELFLKIRLFLVQDLH